MSARLFLTAMVLALAAPAFAQGDFTTLRDQYFAALEGDGSEQGRLDLVGEIAAFDHREAGKALIASVDILSERLDKLLKELAKVEKQHDEVNTTVDVMEDKYKTRDGLRARMSELDGKIALERKILERILEATIALKSEEARAEIIEAASRGKSWRVRTLCGRACASYDGAAARSAALRNLKDREIRVVIGTLEGLGPRKDPATVPDIAKLLNHEAWVIQVMAAKALAEIGSMKAARPLIEALLKTEGRTRTEVNSALQQITGENFQPFYKSWKAWYDEHREEIEGGQAKTLKKKKSKSPHDESTYYGIQTSSKRIVYILDTSGSMDREIGGQGVSTPRPGEEERVSGTKLKIAQVELKNAIRKLPVDAIFNIITFNHVVKRWQEQMVTATQKNKNEAYIYINDLSPKGSTYTYGALKEAFRIAGMGAGDPNYDTGVDTIFLLSDGAPTDQSFPTSKLMDPEKILTAVRQWNTAHKVVIHAIAIDVATQGSAFIKFMKLLATQNGGEYVEKG